MISFSKLQLIATGIYNHLYERRMGSTRGGGSRSSIIVFWNMGFSKNPKGADAIRMAQAELTTQGFIVGEAVCDPAHDCTDVFEAVKPKWMDMDEALEFCAEVVRNSWMDAYSTKRKVDRPFSGTAQAMSVVPA